MGVGKFSGGGSPGRRGRSIGNPGRGMKFSRGGNILCGCLGSWLSKNIGGGILNIGLGGNGGGGGCEFIGWGGEWRAFPTVDAGDDPSDGLHIRRSCAFGVEVRCRTVCEVTVAEHFDVLRFRRFILVFLISFFVSGDFWIGIDSSEGRFCFISFAVGAIVIRGSGDLFWVFCVSVFSVFACLGMFSGFGEPERSELGEADLLLQFLSQSSGVMRLEDDAALTKCGLRSRCACVSRQKMCILYWLRHLSEQNCSCVAPSWNLRDSFIRLRSILGG